MLDWRNTSDQALASFPFHLYWNAFRNNLSTAARGEGRRAPAERMKDERSFGWTEVKSVRLLGEAEEDLTPTLTYLNEDGNADDRTVMQVRTSEPIAPGASARFRIEWESRIPHGSIGRAGWVHDYHFIVQWFPKIGVFWKGQWNCHHFHAWTEFFSDYGVYDVKLTLPRGFVVGATGRLASKTDNADGSESYRFVQEDVHDFAWTASRRFLERRARFDDAGYPPVEIRLLLQPEHAHARRALPGSHEDRAPDLRHLVGALPLRADDGRRPRLGLGLGRDGVPDAVHGRGACSRPRSCRAPRA